MTPHIWLSHYDAGIPATLEPYPQRTLLDYVSESSTQWPDRPALRFKGADLSYRRLEQLSDSFAAALVEQGVMPGDRVALCLPNCPQFVIAELGAWKAGAIVCPFNPLYSDREMEDALNATGAETVVALNRTYQQIKSLSGYQVWPREIEEVISTHPAVAEVGVAGVPDKMRGERAKAWIVLRPGQSLTQSEVKAFCKERLAPYKVPSQFEFVSELPKSAAGKVLRRVLKQMETESESLPPES